MGRGAPKTHTDDKLLLELLQDRRKSGGAGIDYICGHFGWSRARSFKAINELIDEGLATPCEPPAEHKHWYAAT